MKTGSIGNPDIYLGATLRQVMLENGVLVWSANPIKDVQDTVANVEQYIAKTYLDQMLRNKIFGPWPTGFIAELEESLELDVDKSNYYQSQVRVLHWIVELGRVDIITEVLFLHPTWLFLERDICIPSFVYST
jgi:hypothetical protein